MTRAKIVYYAPASNLNNNPDFRDYIEGPQGLTSPTTGVFRYLYDAANLGGQDPDLPATIVGKAENVTFAPDLGVDGDLIVNGGDIYEMRFLAQNGDLMVRIDDLPIDLSLFFAMIEDQQSNSIYSLIGAADNTYIGAAVLDDERGSQIQTGFGDDTVNARSGRDRIYDGGGSDTYDGGSGEDMVDYSQYFYDAPFLVTQGLNANLSTGIIVGPDGNIDTVVRIENIRGTFLDDVMVGNASDNEFHGMHGNDSFDGLGGFDLVTYENERFQGGTEGIVARMGPGIVQDSFGNIDTLVRIEGVEGTDFDDRFFDSARDDYMEGDGGADRFAIAKGNDYVRAGDDDDADLFVFRINTFDHDRIRNFDESDGDTIEFKQIFGMDQLTITVETDGTLIEVDENNTIFLEDVFGVSAAAFEFADLV